MLNDNPNPVQREGPWRFGFVYFNPNNPRIIVPKRVRGLGWTLNFARPMAIPMLLLMIAAVLAPFQILARFGIYSLQSYSITVAVEIIALALFCSWMSNRPRVGEKQKQD